MSILDTFFILFESNADKVKKGSEEATAAGVKLDETLEATNAEAVDAGKQIVAANDKATASIEAMRAAQEAFQATREAGAAMPGGAEGAIPAAPVMPTPEPVAAPVMEAPAVAATEQSEYAFVRLTEVVYELTEALAKMGQAGKRSTHEVEHGAEEAEEKLSFLGRGIEGLKDKFHEFADGVVEQSLEIGAAFQAIFELEKIIDDVFEQAEQSDQLGETARSLGVNIEQLDAWGNAVKRVGGTAEGFQSSLANVNRQLARIAVTGKSRSLKIFQDLGIDATKAKSAFDLLPQLADKIEGMDKARSGGLLRSIGLDEGTVRLLQSGRKEVDELLERQKMLGNITAEDAEIAEKFNREWDDTKQLMRGIVIDLDDSFLPVLHDVLEILIDTVSFLRDHKDFVVGFFIAAGVAATFFAETLGLVDVLWAIATSEITAVIAVVLALSAAFALVYDDVENFLEGNNSVIGELAKRWPIVGEAVRGLANVFAFTRDAIVEGFKDIYAWIEKLPEGFAIWSGIFQRAAADVAGFIDKFKSEIGTLPGWAQTLFADIAEIISVNVSQGTTAAIESFRLFGALCAASVKALGAVIELIGDAFVDPANAVDKFGENMRRIFLGIIADMPELSGAFSEVGKEFEAIGAAIIKIWDEIKAAVESTVGVVTGAISSVEHAGGAVYNAVRHPGSLFDGKLSSDVAPPTVPGSPGSIPPGMAQGQQQLGAIQQAAPMLSQAPGAANAGPTTVHNEAHVSVNVGTVTTNAPDAAALAAELPDHLQTHYSDTLQQLFGNGSIN